MERALGGSCSMVGYVALRDFVTAATSRQTNAGVER